MKRKISLIVIGLALVLIPTFIMLSFYLSNRSIPVEIRNAEQVIMVTPDEEVIKAQSSGENKELLQMMCDMTQDAKSVEKLPEEAELCKLFQVTFRTGKSSLIYKFYFGENPAYCYYVTDTEEVWRIDTEKSQLFLNSQYSETVYGYSLPPKVFLGEELMIATQLDWEYRLLDGTYRKSGLCVENQQTEPIDMGILDAPISVSSSLPYDQMIVNAYDSKGNLLYSGDGSGIENIEVNEYTEISIKISLEWKKDASGRAPYAGSAVYRAVAKKSPPAEFSISDSVIGAGQTFVIKGNHVENIDKVKISIEPSVDFTAKWVSEGTQMKALLTLGFPEAYEADAEYVITLSSEEWTEPKSFTVTVKKGDYGEFRDYVSRDTLEQTFGISQKNELLDCMREIMAQPTTYHFADGKIEFGPAVLTPDSSRSYQYGSQVLIHLTGASYRAFDTMYCTYSASKPIAVADGKVLFVGETALTGKIIVIDHGQGIRSWYCNLSEITVAAGQILQKGDVIGKCMGGGFNGQGGLNMHVALTLENVALDLNWAIENGIEY